MVLLYPSFINKLDWEEISDYSRTKRAVICNSSSTFTNSNYFKQDGDIFKGKEGGGGGGGGGG